MKRENFVSAAMLPAISKEVLIALDAAFPRPEIKVGFDRDEALVRAGAREVVDWIVARAGYGTSVSGDPADIVTEHHARVRIGHK